MRKISILFLTAALMFPASLAAAEVVRLTRYAGERLTGITAGFLFRVELIASEETKAVVEVPVEVEDYLVFEKASNGVVRVDMRLPRGFEHNFRRFWDTHSVVLKIYTPTIEYIRLGTAAKATASGHFTADQTVIDLETASRLDEISLTARTLLVKLDGASSARIRAHAQSADLRLEGAGKLDLDLNENRDVKIDVSGAGKLILNLPSNKNVDMKISGAGNATLTGEGHSLTAVVSGAARVMAGAFHARRVDVAASGASRATVYASEYLKIYTSVASKVQYAGDPAEKHISNPNVSEIK